MMEASWLSYNNGEYDLDYTHAFDNGNKYDRSDRAIASGSQADFGFDFETPTVVDAYRITVCGIEGHDVLAAEG